MSLTDSIRVLIVDDDPAVAGVMRRMLEPHYDVTVAGSVPEAERVLESKPIDLIVSDICMPGLTGLDLHERVRSRSPDLAQRMVFVTAGGCTHDVAHALEALPNPRLDKPFTAEDLRSVVAAVACLAED